MGNNLGYFVGNEMLPTVDYSPDLGKRRLGGVPVVGRGGEPCKDMLYQEVAIELAAALKAKVVDFPDYHHGYLTAPETFAERLVESLSAY